MAVPSRNMLIETVSKRVEIDKNKKLKAGDIIELEFNIGQANTWIRATQLALIEGRLKDKYPAFEMLSNRFEDDDKKIVYRFVVKSLDNMPPEIQKAGISPALVIIAVTTIAAGVLVWMTAGKVYQIVEAAKDQPILQTGIASVGIAAALVPIAVILFIILGVKK